MKQAGRSNPSMSLAPPLESQDVSRYQAVDIDPMYWGGKNPPPPWRRLAEYAVAIVLVSAAWSLIFLVLHETLR